MKWPNAKLSEVSLGKPQYGANAPATFYTGKRPRYIRITDIDATGIVSLNGKVEADLQDFSRFLLQENDLLFARSGATVGKTYLYNSLDGPSIYAGYLIRFKLNSKIGLMTS